MRIRRKRAHGEGARHRGSRYAYDRTWQSGASAPRKRRAWLGWTLCVGVLALGVGVGALLALPGQVTDESAFRKAGTCGSSVPATDTGAGCLRPVRLTVTSVGETTEGKSKVRRVGFDGKGWSGTVNFADDSRFGEEVAEGDTVRGSLWHDSLVAVTWAGEHQKSTSDPRGESVALTGFVLGGLSIGPLCLRAGVRRVRRTGWRRPHGPAGYAQDREADDLVSACFTLGLAALLPGALLGALGLPWWSLPPLWAALVGTAWAVYLRWREPGRKRTSALALRPE
ncbi:hypothetical protein GA0115251_118119 [Streptomyces sp. TverLS-915]|uniref:hypothetical protein n=1 Tax=unclassified Streptomyces TaxID=2593676 RepID=UPI00081DB447|nr:hypothetical protein [Streptomyces sp. TverLS-915]SCD67617.1 hypothetical protein GA0115251_118119 [Streptomyces sp. TverLS-915]